MSSDTTHSNFVTGIGKGIATMGVGVAAGAAAVVALPAAGFIAGKKKGGIGGGVLGLLGGTLGGVVGLGGGVLVGMGGGAFMMVKGFIDTPGAIVAFARNDDLHGREKVNLDEVEVRDKAEKDRMSQAQEAVLDDAAAEGEYVPKAYVADTTLYDALGASPDSSASVLKRKYYKLAQQHHPDKGGDTAKFQQVGEAYTILSDPKKRAKYDENGMEALKDSPKSDPGIVFAMMFGEEKLEPYCGELTQVMTMRLADQEKYKDDQKAMKTELARMQKLRNLELAKQLAVRLDGWIADPEKWVAEQIEIYSGLLNVNLGPQMTCSVGIMYEIHAEEHLGVQSRMAQLGFGNVKAGAHQTKVLSRMLAAAKTLSDEKDKADKEDEKSPEEQAKKRNELEESMFNIMALDIESAVGTAASLCLADVAVSKEVRQQRAKGMLKLGLIFQGKLEAPEPA